MQARRGSSRVVAGLWKGCWRKAPDLWVHHGLLRRVAASVSKGLYSVLQIPQATAACEQSAAVNAIDDKVQEELLGCASVTLGCDLYQAKKHFHRSCPERATALQHHSKQRPTGCCVNCCCSGQDSAADGVQCAPVECWIVLLRQQIGTDYMESAQII